MDDRSGSEAQAAFAMWVTGLVLLPIGALVLLARKLTGAMRPERRRRQA